MKGEKNNRGKAIRIMRRIFSFVCCFGNRRIKMGVLLFGMIFMTGIFTCTRFAYASSGNINEKKSETRIEAEPLKCYKSIMIYFGDTLESVAEKYMTKDFASTEDFTNEVRQINHLHANTALIPGNYIIIPCY